MSDMAHVITFTIRTEMQANYKSSFVFVHVLIFALINAYVHSKILNFHLAAYLLAVAHQTVQNFANPNITQSLQM